MSKIARRRWEAISIFVVALSPISFDTFFFLSVFLFRFVPFRPVAQYFLFSFFGGLQNGAVRRSCTYALNDQIQIFKTGRCIAIVCDRWRACGMEVNRSEQRIKSICVERERERCVEAKLTGYGKNFVTRIFCSCHSISEFVAAPISLSEWNSKAHSQIASGAKSPQHSRNNSLVASRSVPIDWGSLQAIGRSSARPDWTEWDFEISGIIRTTQKKKTTIEWSKTSTHVKQILQILYILNGVS